MTIRVVIVDDSPFVREVLRKLLAPYRDIEVIGEASDGERAIEAAAKLRPDVMTMDLLMPLVGGLEAIRRITASQRTPIIVLSDNADTQALDALDAGAVEVVLKPRAGFTGADADRLASLIRTSATACVAPPRSQGRTQLDNNDTRQAREARAIGIVASSGGPPVLRKLIATIPPTTQASVFVVQHTTAGSTESLARWLRPETALKVVVARPDVAIEPATAYLAPDDAHLIVASGRLALTDDPPLASHRPSGTVLLRSLAAAYDRKLVAVVATGMGNDGSEGLRSASEQGALTIVQSPHSATVDGMPKRALETVPDALVLDVDAIRQLLQVAGTS